ncbi:CPCC family cysteine-rich protein [Niallia sp. JL1B1071]|uniref:CPCC family cysteine-rich protein n=1 Tax=Niallia tiangongensis TaxID=3237105 RepID=UPI0037DC38C4
MSESLHTCPCCGYKTLSERNSWEIFRVCKWEDDELQFLEPDLGGGANEESLREAQKNFKEIGICSKKLIHWKNTADLNDEKDKNFKPLD